MPVQRFADLTVDPKNVVLVSKNTGDSECCCVVKDPSCMQATIRISTAAADALLEHFGTNDTDHAGGERDSDFNSHVVAASRASDCSRLGDYMFDDILHQFNLFFQGSAKAEVLDGQLHITIGTQTMIVTLPQVAGVQSTAS